MYCHDIYLSLAHRGAFEMWTHTSFISMYVDTQPTGFVRLCTSSHVASSAKMAGHASAILATLSKPSSVMQAFAQFADPGSCAAAKAAIHGRMFAGETIRAQYVTPQYFAQLPR